MQSYCVQSYVLQVEVVLHAAGTPSNSRSLSLTRQKVAINPVSHATCTGIPAAALPTGEQLGLAVVLRPHAVLYG